MVSRKSATKSKGKAIRKDGKRRDVKKRIGSKVMKRTKTPTRDVAKRRRKAAMDKSATPAGSPTLANNGTIEEVRSSMDDIIDNAKKVVGVE